MAEDAFTPRYDIELPEDVSNSVELSNTDTDRIDEDSLEQFVCSDVLGIDEDAELIEDQTEKIERLKNTILMAGSVAIGATALSLWGFELGPWNEAVRANFGFEVFKRTLSEFRVAGAVGAFTLALEGVSSVLIVAGLNSKHMPGRHGVEWVTNWISSANSGKERTRSDIAEDLALAGAAGAGVVAAKRHFTEPDITPKEEVKGALVSSAFIAAQSSIIAFLLAGGVKHAAAVEDKIDGLGDKYGQLAPITDHLYLENWSQWLIDHGTDQKLWLGVFAALWLKNKSNRDMIRAVVKTKFGRKSEVKEPVATESGEE